MDRAIEVRAVRVSRGIRLLAFSVTMIYLSVTGVPSVLGLRHAPTFFLEGLADLAVAVVVSRAVLRWAGVKPLSPVRVTASFLEVPGPDGPVRASWADVARAEVRGGRLSPRLVVVPVNADRFHPAPNAWDRVAASGRGSYRIVVPLAGRRADRVRLQVELAARSLVESQ